MPEILDDRLALGFSAGPRFNTSTFTFGGGRQVSNVNWSFAPKFFSFAKNNCLIADAVAIMNFFYERRGSAESFLMKDWTDATLTNELIGVGGDDINAFQAAKTYGTANPFSRDITGLSEAGLVVTVNGTPVTPTSVVNGLITLPSSPGAGQEVRVTGSFYSLVRFAQDEIDVIVDGPAGAYGRIEKLTAVEILA